MSGGVRMSESPFKDLPLREKKHYNKSIVVPSKHPLIEGVRISESLLRDVPLYNYYTVTDML